MIPQDQPSVSGLLHRLSEELCAHAVLLLHEDGQVLERSGQVPEREFPALAALIAAMIATGKSLDRLGEHFPEAPSRFACDSDRVGLYAVMVQPGIWLAALYEQPLMPGQLRMKLRRFAATLARLGVSRPQQWELGESAQGGATLPPVPQGEAVTTEKITGVKASLFENISDSEIDELFENARS